jgi:FlaA1/EpsC-like NDP-sugar epimerase
VTVRFGNVLDSTGSVVPLFRKQIEMGGPVTVTHPEVMRYFMTIPEAAQLILQATFLGNGGEIFVLDMGSPIKIRYLAEQMIKLSGKLVDKDIKIIYTGLRPGEKLFEECFYSHEQLQPTNHAKIMQAKSNSFDYNIVSNICNRIEQACLSNDATALVMLLQLLVPEYNVSQNKSANYESEKILA